MHCSFHAKAEWRRLHWERDGLCYVDTSGGAAHGTHAALFIVGPPGSRAWRSAYMPGGL